MATNDAKVLSKAILLNVKQASLKNMERAGQEIVEQAQKMLKANVGGYTKLVDTVGYEIHDNVIEIYCTSKIGKFLEEGTKPHKIRAKNGKALAFRSRGSAVTKKGKKINFGDKVVVQEVNHPGFDPRPWFHIAVFSKKAHVTQILQGRR